MTLLHRRSRPALSSSFAFASVFALIAALAAGTTPALAQGSQAASADAIVSAGLAVLRKVDENRSGELWDEASPVTRAAMPKAAFVQGLREARASVGDVRRRDWASITRVRYLDGSTTPPPGLYANVDVSTQLADGRTVFEKVSFRLEREGWRFTGYEPRQSQ